MQSSWGGRHLHSLPGARFGHSSPGGPEAACPPLTYVLRPTASALCPTSKGNQPAAPAPAVGNLLEPPAGSCLLVCGSVAPSPACPFLLAPWSDSRCPHQFPPCCPAVAGLWRGAPSSGCLLPPPPVRWDGAGSRASRTAAFLPVCSDFLGLMGNA